MVSLQDELKIFKEKTINTYYNNALDLVKNNNISKAVEVMEKSLEDITEDIQVLNLMGICQYILCDFDKANLSWKKSLIFNNDDDNRARYYLESLNSEKFKSFTEYYNLSLSYIEKFRYEEAIELLLEINKTNKDLIEPYALLGNCYYALQEHELAKEYLEQALTRDVDNLKYLKYLNKINNNLPLNKKNNIINYKILYSIIVLFIIIISLSFYRKYKGKVKVLKTEVDKNKLEYSKLEEKFKNEKERTEKENDKKDVNIDADKVVSDKNLSFNGSDLEILKDAMKELSNEKYNESIDRFQYLIDKSNNEDIKAESIYFIAVSYEEIEEYDKAGNYYNLYIDKYSEKNYYDDSLYNYGLMLYKNNDIESAKKILSKLKNELPESEFMNSKVKSILES